MCMKCFLLHFSSIHYCLLDACDVSKSYGLFIEHQIMKKMKRKNYQIFVLEMKIKDRYALLAAVSMQCMPVFLYFTSFHFTEGKKTHFRPSKRYEENEFN